MTTRNPVWLGAVVELPPRDHRPFAGLARALRDAGLAPHYLLTGRRLASPASAGALGPALGASVLVEALKAVGVSAAMLGAAPAPFGEAALVEASQDPDVAWIEVGGRSPDWRLRLPRDWGFLTGVLTDGDAELLAQPALDLFGHLFDMHLVEWGLVGPDALLRAAFTGVAPTMPDEPARLPGLGWVTYASLDLAHQTDVTRLREIEGIRVTRTHTGAVTLSLASPSAPAALDGLRARCPELLQSWQRPPIDAYARPAGPPLLLRNVSPGLAAWQRSMAGVVIEEAARRGLVELRPSLAGLYRLDQCLLPAATALPPHVLAGWSAFAGEAAVQAGGRWRRILDPLLRDSENLLVQLPGGRAYQPHIVLVEMLEGRSAVTPAQALETQLSAAGPR